MTFSRVAPGDYFLLVVANGNGQQGETDDYDNVLSVPVTITVPDVAPTVLNAPDSAILGETIQISWTVSNPSSEVVAADWSDRVYLSDDNVLEYRFGPLGCIVLEQLQDPPESR